MSQQKRHYIDKTIWIIIVFVGLTLFLVSHGSGDVAAGSINDSYCDDKEFWVEWEALAAKYPDDEDVIILHALRIGLCEKANSLYD